MQAICVTPRQRDSASLRQVSEPRPARKEVLVRTLQVGVCGTDLEIIQGLYGEAPPGDAYLILGHESLGVVETAGRGVDGFRKGDLVVATVRRPCPERCLNCRAGENDMCLTGHFQERGIRGRHGFLAEVYAEAPEYLVRVPARFRSDAVLLEPLSIVEKGIAQIYAIQGRLRWRPRTAVVLGAGTVGLLTALVLRLHGLATYAWDRVPPGSARAKLVEAMGGTYLQSEANPLGDLPARLGNLDILVEATGNARIVFDAAQALGVNGVLCLMSVTGGHQQVPVPVDRINLEMVLGNKVVFGTVNANRRYFEMGVKHLASAERRWPGLLGRFITRSVPMDRFADALARRPDDIKTVVRVAAA